MFGEKLNFAFQKSIIMKKESKISLISIGVLLAVVVIYGVLSRSSNMKEFKENGIETTATVVDVVKKRDRNVTGRKRISSFLEVTFFTQNEKLDSLKNSKTTEKDEEGNYTFNFDKLKVDIGEYINTDIPINSSQFNRLKKGDKVQILYLPDDPDNAILKEDIE